MPTKTISLDLEAHELLRAARLRPDESFSQVIKRGQWPVAQRNGRALAEALTTFPRLTVEQFEALDRAQQEDLVYDL